ncbi:DUF7619 domain-containing protein [Winogradskyella sp.]|uniref:T9SS type A sorting domain-containing protein n=1 Tax=Winogradskyella sp. TaxID=1883156 RepID=UPI003AB1439E
MKVKLYFALFLFYSFQIHSQTIKNDAYLIGTKLSFYPNQCGNSIPEAEGKLTFCDKINNLGVVEESTGLNDRRVNRMLPNYFNADEFYVTGKGLSIRNVDGTWENIPNIAIPVKNTQGDWTNNGTITNGLVLPDGKVIIQASNFNEGLNVYNRTTKTFDLISFPDNRYPTLFAYDASRGFTWIIAHGPGGSGRFLYTYDGITLNYIQELVNASQISTSINTSKLIYHDNHLYASSNSGLFKIDITNFLMPNVTTIQYNASTTPGLPFNHVSDLQFDVNGDLWLSQSANADGGIVKFNLENETYELYQVAKENNPSLNHSFNAFAIDNLGTIWAAASSSSSLYKLTFPSGVETWETITRADLAAFGVPVTYSPSEMYFANDQFYFTTVDYSSGNSTNFEVLINNNDVWSGRNDNALGNTSYWSNNRFNFTLAGLEGGVWWFNHYDDIIVHRKANDEQYIFTNFNDLGYLGAIDVDGKPVVTIGTSRLSKIDLPVYYSLLNDSNQTTNGIASYKDQIWWYNRDMKRIKVLKHNQVIATFDLWESYQSIYNFGVDSNGKAWFMHYPGNGDLLIKKFDPNTEVITDYTLTQGIGSLKKIIPAPNGHIWFVGGSGLVYYDGDTFTTYLASDYAELYNIKSLVVDINSTAYVLLNDAAAITKIENAGTESVSFSMTVIEGTNSVLPALGHYRPDDITIDNQGAIWTNASQNTFKLTDVNAAKEYRIEGETFSLSGLVYNDINENDAFDEGEEYSGQLVALKLNDKVYNTFTDTEGIYRFYLYEENAEYEITLPTIGQFVTASSRQLLVNVGEDDQNYDGNDFQLKPKFVNSLYVKSSSKTGAWGFVRANFENTFTTAIGNVSASKTFHNLDVTYTFKNDDENSTNVLPSIEDVKVYELDPNGSSQLIERVTIDQISNKWSVNAEVSSYVQTELPITPELTEASSQTDIKITIPTVSPLNTYIIEINTGLFDPVETGTVINHGVSKIDSDDFVDNNNVPINTPVILIPLEDRDYDFSGFPFQFDDTPYINPDDVYSDPPYVDPKQIYAPAPYRTKIYSSYDPNDKLVDEGVPGDINDRHIERKWLTYTIRFENSGNFSAKDIVVTDVLDAYLDPNSVKVIEASHDYDVDIIKNGQDETMLKFSFNDIFLPFEDESNDGYIKFMVKANEDISENTVVDNVANIYFDQNPPIITNVVQTRFLTIASLGVEENSLEAQFKMYPNPSQGTVTIASELAIEKIEIFSLLGKKVFESKTKSINVSHLVEGTYILKVTSVNGTLSKKLIIN